MKNICILITVILVFSLNGLVVSGSADVGINDKPRSAYVIPNNSVNGIKITFSAMTATEEANFIVELLKKYDWYKSNGYNISLPNHPLVEKVKSGGSLEPAKISQFKTDFINNIYSSSNYQAGLARLEGSRSKILSCFPAFIDYQNKWKSNNWNLKTFPEYTIKLTLYGPGGSYNSRTGVVTMLTTTAGEFKRGSEPGETIVHEMTHMAIEEFIIKYNVPHWVKERIVDRFVDYHFSAIFPNYKMQRSGDKSIDTYLDQPDSWDKLPYYISQY